MKNSGKALIKDLAKTKQQLIEELSEIRRRFGDLQSGDIYQELLKSETRYRLLADNVSDVIWTMDMNRKFTYYSPSVIQLRGYTSEDAMTMTLQETLTPASFQVVIKAMEEELALEAAEPKNLSRSRMLDLEEVCKDGSTVWVEVKITYLRGQDDRPVGILGVSRNITERRQAEETVKRLAFYDQATGLPNRVLFNDRLNIAILHARRNKKKLAVMLLDLDRFKDVNDTFGHHVGDQLLQSVGKRLSGLLRDSDTVSRMGGDEFLVLLPDINYKEDAAIVAQKFVRAFQEPFVINGRKFRITASIGVSVYPTHSRSADTLVRDADIAMYRAKATGRNNWQWFAHDLAAK